MPVSRARRRAQQRLPHETIPALNTIGEYRTEFRWQPVEGRAKAKYEVEWNSFWIWLGTYLEGRNKPKKQHS